MAFNMTNSKALLSDIKLLCNNFAGLEDRLINIEGDLSRLTNLVKKNDSLTGPIERTAEEADCDNSVLEGKHAEDNSTLPPKDRHIVRDRGSFIDRYHGPGTLFSLCHNFRETAFSEQRRQDLPSDDEDTSPHNDELEIFRGNEDVEDLLAHLCLEASPEDFPLTGQQEYVPIRLPPKQFLVIIQAQFFHQVNYATDIFVQSHFLSNVERIYNRPFSPDDEVWAVCFKTIILLVLGSEVSPVQNNDSVFGSQFARSFLSTVRTALSNPRFLMSPRLINIQALDLLSVAAQQYYQPGFAESILAQACVLAKTMGLHQAHASQDDVSEEEQQERHNTFRSLYLRDKAFAVSRGSVCWLPSSDCSFSWAPGGNSYTQSKWRARIEVARLQEEVYSLFYSASSCCLSPSKLRHTLSSLEQSFENWASAHNVQNSTTQDGCSVDMQLDFLSARIHAFSDSSQKSHIIRTLNDSRASCILLLISYGQNDCNMSDRLDSLLSSSTKSNSFSDICLNTKKGKSPPKQTEVIAAGRLSPSLPLLLDSFSILGFFLLAKHVLFDLLQEENSQIDSDLDLLKRVATCYKEFGMRIQTVNYTQKVGRVLARVLEIVNFMRSSPQRHETHQASNNETAQNVQNYFDESHDFSDFNNVAVLSSDATPPFGFEKLSNHNSSRSMSDMSSAVATPPLLTPVEPQYTGQLYDALGQRNSNFQDTSMAGRKRPSDMFVDDDPDSSLLSDFLSVHGETQYGGPVEALSQRQFSFNTHQQDFRPSNRRRKILSDLDTSIENDADSRLLSDFLAAEYSWLETPSY